MLLLLAKRLAERGAIHFFNGPVIPLGAEISHKPISRKDRQRVHQFCNRMLSDILKDYALNTGEDPQETCSLQNGTTW